MSNKMTDEEAHQFIVNKMKELGVICIRKGMSIPFFLERILFVCISVLTDQVGKEMAKEVVNNAFTMSDDNASAEMLKDGE